MQTVSQWLDSQGYSVYKLHKNFFSAYSMTNTYRIITELDKLIETGKGVAPSKEALDILANVPDFPILEVCKVANRIPQCIDAYLLENPTLFHSLLEASS